MHEPEGSRRTCAEITFPEAASFREGMRTIYVIDARAKEGVCRPPRKKHPCAHEPLNTQLLHLHLPRVMQIRNLANDNSHNLREYRINLIGLIIYMLYPISTGAAGCA